MNQLNAHSMNIEEITKVLDSNLESIQKSIMEAIDYLHKYNGPYALIIRKNLFKEYEKIKQISEVIQIIRDLS